jgi:hypothetical protein
MTAERYVPTVPASQIPYVCWCGFRGTYDQREAHRAEHRKRGEK